MRRRRCRAEAERSAPVNRRGEQAWLIAALPVSGMVDERPFATAHSSAASSSKGSVMSWWRLLVMTGMLAGGPALAADMPGSWAPPPALVPSAVWPLNGNWYVRGDLGYAWGRIGSAEAAAGFPNPDSNDFGSSFLGGIGAGYKGAWLRTDLTLDYSRFNYSATFTPSGDASAKVGVLTAMFNGYLDLGTWYGLTPYIGAGAGAAYLSTSDYTSTVAPPFTTGLSHTQWNFTWALMSGVAFSVTPNLAVDVGYRYLALGDVSTASDATGAMLLKNLAAHEVRVGVRWNFDDAPLH
jgi:opacity protein-like surface antigen